MGKSLFVSLRKWAGSQDENFITEALVYLIEFYIQHEVSAAIYLVGKITGERLSLASDELQSTSILTQIHSCAGIPDVKIENNSFLGFIEVKVDANFSKGQLKRYNDELQRLCSNRNISTSLITLTRHPIDQHNADFVPGYSFLWSELHAWLLEIISGTNMLSTDTGRFLTQEYISFLKWRGLVMSKISWELPEGVRSLKCVVDLLGQALRSSGIKIMSKTGAWDWMGYYIDINGDKYFIGIYYDDPSKVVINTEFIVNIGLGQEEAGVGIYVGNGWRNELDMESEQEYFFARSSHSQLGRLNSFIKESVAFALSISRI